MNLTTWGNFYALVGSAAGALIGLQFVVITLVANIPGRADIAAINAFGSPTVVHFGSALVISAFLSAPWSSPHAISVALILGGIAGLVYSVVVFRRAAHQAGYKPVLEDWICFVIVPSVIYALLVVAGVMLHVSLHAGLFFTAALTLALLLIGVRNAWDTVVHLCVNNPSQKNPG